MKRKICAALISCFLTALLLCGCADIGSAENSPPMPKNGQYYFDAAVKEIYGETLLVECTDCPDGVMSAGTQVSVSPSRAEISASASAFHIGQHVRIIYSGNVMETYPLQIGELYGVYPLDGAVHCD